MRFDCIESWKKSGQWAKSMLQKEENYKRFIVCGELEKKMLFRKKNKKGAYLIGIQFLSLFKLFDIMKIRRIITYRF